MLKSIFGFGILSIGILCGLTIYVQINGLKTELANVRREVTGVTNRVEKLNRDLAEIAAPNTVQTLPELPDNRARPRVFDLTGSDIQLIRQFVKVPPPQPGVAGKLVAGDVLPNSRVAPVPEPLVERLPKLRGAKFTVDLNSAIIISGPGSNRVDVVIP